MELSGLVGLGRHSSSGFVALAEGRDLLLNAVFSHFKIGRLETSHIVALAVHDGHVQLHHVDFDANAGFAFLRRRPAN